MIVYGSVVPLLLTDTTLNVTDEQPGVMVASSTSDR